MRLLLLSCRVGGVRPCRRWHRVEAGSAVLTAESLIDLDEDILLALGQRRVGPDGRYQLGAGGPVLQDAGPDVELLGRDPQALGDLLQDLGTRAAQAPLDLGQV